VARPRGFVQRGQRASRRKSTWGPGPGGVSVTSISATGAAIPGSGISPTTVGLTMVRIRGQLDLMLLTAGTVGDGFQGAFGIGIVETPAFTAGAASVPTPITEAASENWLYWHVLSVHDSLNSDGASVQRLEVDTKAMRKFDDGMTIYAAFELTEIGTATASLFFDSRALALIA